MKKQKESVILYIRVFFVIFVIGYILPNIIGLIFNYLIIKPQIKPPENYLFVINHLGKSKSFYAVFFKILVKLMEF